MDRQMPGAVTLLCIVDVNGTTLAIVEQGGVQMPISVFEISAEVFNFLLFLGVPVCPVQSLPTPTPTTTPTITPTF